MSNMVLRDASASKNIIVTMIISVRSSGKYAGSVMAVEVVKERTIETRQDVSFIPQSHSDKKISDKEAAAGHF